MRTFVIGLTGGVGRRLAGDLLARGDDVRGLVRRGSQRADLAGRGVRAAVGDLTTMDADALAAAIRGADALVFAAGSNGGARAVTDAVDGRGLATAIEAARRAAVPRFVSVSVLPEAERELVLDEDVEHYYAVKKVGDVALAASDLDWVVLRPSLLVDGPGAGTVTLGPAALHGQVARADVATTVAELLHEPRIARQVLELDAGTTPIRDAVRANVRAALG